MKGSYNIFKELEKFNIQEAEGAEEDKDFFSPEMAKNKGSPTLTTLCL